jgi:dTDP-4-dehydrorhamnose reductase
LHESQTLILVTGGNGQLATALEKRAWNAGLPLRRVGRPTCDFDRLDTLDALVAETQPTIVINAAAYTAVDAAESDAEAAMRANRDGPARLAALCHRDGIRFVHVSTDYVFDGTKGAPYVETDPTCPTGVYGSTKLAGEVAVMQAFPEALILRTAWVYASTGKNFVRTMLNAGRRMDRLRVVADQRGCPTTAHDLAVAILRIVAQPPKASGIFHAAGSGWTTWHGLAVAVFEEAARYGGPSPAVDAITTADWPTPAKRPADSRLDCTKMETTFGVSLPEWRPSLANTIDEIFAADR